MSQDRSAQSADSRAPRDQLLTPAQVADLFCVSVGTVTRWALAGKLPCVRTPGNRRRFRVSDVRAFVAETRTP